MRLPHRNAQAYISPHRSHLYFKNTCMSVYLSVLGVTPVTSQVEWSCVVSQLPNPSISISAAPEQRSKVKRTSCGRQGNCDKLQQPPYF